LHMCHHLRHKMHKFEAFYLGLIIGSLWIWSYSWLMTGRNGLLDNSDFAHVHYNANYQSFFTYRTNWIYFVQDDVLALDKYSDDGFELVYKRIGFAFKVLHTIKCFLFLLKSCLTSIIVVFSCKSWFVHFVHSCNFHVRNIF
jgi:hypothetical protein